MHKKLIRYFFTGVLMTFCVPFATAYTNSECVMAKDLGDNGIIYKESDCRDYNLDRTIYRQEVAALALRVAEKCGIIDDIPDLDDYDCDNVFYDVTRTRPNSWACRSVEILAENDIITTSRRDTFGRAFFQPMKDITKSEALSMIMDSAGFDFRGERYDDWRFTGTGAVNWQKPVMQYAEDNDIIASISSFRPNTVAYRREVFSYAQKVIEHCEDINGGGSSSGNDGDNFLVTTDDSSPDTNDWVDVTIRARDGSSTNDSYRGGVEFEVYYRRSSSSSWTKTTSSSYYEIDEEYEDGYTFKSSDDGEKKLSNFIRFKKDDYQYKLIVTDEDDNDVEGYKIFAVGDVDDNNSNEDTDNLYITASDTSPDNNDWIDITVRARDGSSTDTLYRGSVEFEIYYRSSSSSSWTKTTSSSYYEIDEDYEDGYTFTSSNKGQKTFYDLIRFKKEYEYKIVVVDEDDDDIEGYKILSVGDADNNDDGDTDNFYINTDDSSPDTYDWVDLTVRARDGSYTDTEYRGSVEFEVYYRRSGSSSWTKTTSSSYYEIDEEYEDGYTFRSSDDGQETFNNFIQFKKDDYEYKVVVMDEDDEDIEGYKIFRVGDYSSSECGLGEYESGGNCYACTGRPSNAYYETEGSCDWTCNSGYVERNGACEYSSQLCGVGQYANGNSCYNCTTKPSSAYYTNYGTCDWSCDSGYYRNGDTCVSGATTCGIGQIANGNSCQSCVSAPANSYYTTAGSCSWACNTNYYSSGSQCIPYTQNCGVGQQLSGNVCVNCTSKPAHSAYSQSGTCDWACDIGYTRDGSSCVPTQNYSWYTGGWNSCSVSCGGGTQTRVVECRSSLGYVVQNWQCAGTAPTSSQACNTHACNTETYAWKTGNWGTCQNSVQDRTVLCERNDGNIVSNIYCNSDIKPATSQSCNTTTYSWSTGTWGTCTNGSQTRTVVCKNSNNTTVADSYCSDSKPTTTQNCSSWTYTWKTGNWGTCINNNQDRTVLCERNDGNIVSNTYCNSTTKPATSQSCNTVTYSWSTGTWGTCTNGSQTRTVVCKNSNNVTVANSYCSGTKPSTTRSCTTYSWYRGNPNTCGDTCNTTREVVCRNDSGQTVADSYCTTSKPSHICSRELAWLDADGTASCNTICNQNNSCWVEDSRAQACASGERIPTWGTFDFLFGKITNPTNLGGYYIYERDNRFYCYGKTQTRDYDKTDKVVGCLCQ